MSSKSETYQTLLPQIEALMAGEKDMIAKMANICAALHEAFCFWWTGFYRVIDSPDAQPAGKELVLGPFQGPVACMHIPFGRGVCGTVQGYAFCQITETTGDRLLQDGKTLYIDDICVDESARGKHIGKALFEHVRNYARSIGCHNITLNVWEGNEAALRFYHTMGMQPQKTGMEIVF